MTNSPFARASADLEDRVDTLDEEMQGVKSKLASIESDLAKLADLIESVLGSPSPEPEPEPLWEDDFADDWRGRWPVRWSEPDDRYAVKEYFERDGETWMRVIYPKGGLSKGMKFTSRHPQANRVYLQYCLRFNEDFDWVLGGKLPGLGAGSVRPGERPDGADGWLARLMWRENGRGVAYVYHPDQPGRWGENIEFDGPRFQRGVIHKIGMEVIVNTPGERDGILRVWLDDALVVERTDMRWRTVSALKIDGIAFSTFFGGNTSDWAPKKDERAEFGGFKLQVKP